MKITFIIASLLLCFASTAQVNENEISFNPDTLLKPRKTNPVIFADFTVGGAGGSSKGIFINASLNYEFKKNLITARIGAIDDYNVKTFSPAIPLPVFELQEEIQEYGLLYGRRIVWPNRAFSFSAGVSLNYRHVLQFENNEWGYDRRYHAGIPFEVSIKWFKRNKSPYHIHCVLPVGPPTGLAHSFGFKLIGNVSTTTFVGVGLSWGWGWHKNYYD